MSTSSVDKRKPSQDGIARGARLRAFREMFLAADARYTQEYVADLGGLGRTDVTRIETGWNQGTSGRIWSALGTAFEVFPETIASLLDGTISPAQAFARRGEISHEQRLEPATLVPKISDRPEWESILPEAKRIAASLERIPADAEVWAKVAQIQDDHGLFPRRLHASFLVNAARWLLTPDPPEEPAPTTLSSKKLGGVHS